MGVEESCSASDIADRICRSESLPTVPAVALTIMNKCKDDDVDFGELASLIGSDPALAARILRLANSAALGGRRRITSLRPALTRLGLRLTHATVLGFALAAQTDAMGDFDSTHFWRYSLSTSHAARAISKCTGRLDPDDAFAAGLLQDVGVLALCCALGDDYRAVLEDHRESAQPLQELEEETVGTTHTLVGAELLSGWGLPDALCRPVRYHHCAEEAIPDGLTEESAELGRTLRLADGVAQVFNGPDRNVRHEHLLTAARGPFGLTRSEMRTILSDVGAGVQSSAAAFRIDVGSVLSYADIRARSMQKVIELTAEIQAGFHEYQARAERTRQELSELEEEHRKVRKQAMRDELTGAMTRAAFMERLEDELHKGDDEGKQLAFALLDIDRFKSVNDGLGHPAGDRVLESFGDQLQRALRGTDAVGRYGGDEFAILLPDTDMEAALSVAERIRRGVGHASKSWVDGVDGITISVGLVHSNGSPLAGQAERVVEEADKCLYAAKEDGRNCVRYRSL